MMSTIAIEGMSFYAHHGCYEMEQEKGNQFEVDVYIETDVSKAAQSDDISDTLNYEKVYDEIKYQMNIRSKLIEHVGKRIIDALKKKFPEIESIELTIAKLHPFLHGPVDSVSITLED